MIKILDIATTSQGAYRLLRLRVSEFNKESEYSNSIVCPEGSEVALMRKEGIPVYTIQMSRGLNPFKLPSEIRSLIRIFEEYKPDIIHSHNSKAGGVSRLAAYVYNKKKKNVKIVVMHQVHGFVFSRYSGFKRSVFIILERLFSRMTDYLLFQNNHDMDFANNKNFGKKTQLIKIGNGISFSELINEGPSANKNERKKIVCVARLEAVKNQTMLIHALGILKEKYKFVGFECSFLGEGDNAIYTELVQNLELDEYVRFCGKVSRDEIVEYYSRADLNVLTSLTEGMPRALMEAVYMGVPSIATRVVGTTDVIKPGISGELVELDDVEGLAALMFELLNNEKRRLQLIESGIQYAREHFNEQDVIERLRVLYKKAVTY